jgi:hypothetical protein
MNKKNQQKAGKQAEVDDEDEIKDGRGCLKIRYTLGPDYRKKKGVNKRNRRILQS